MIKDIAGAKPERSQAVRRTIRLLLKKTENAAQFLEGENVRAIRLPIGERKPSRGVFCNPALEHQVAAEFMKSAAPILEGNGFDPALVLAQQAQPKPAIALLYAGYGVKSRLRFCKWLI